jgi:hypothetical protein
MATNYEDDSKKKPYKVSMENFACGSFEMTLRTNFSSVWAFCVSRALHAMITSNQRRKSSIFQDIDVYPPKKFFFFSITHKEICL